MIYRLAMKPVTKLWCNFVNGYKLVMNLVTNLLSMVTKLWWNLLQTCNETCHKLTKLWWRFRTMVTELLMKLVTNLCKVGEEPFPAHSRHYWGRCLFSVKGGSQARPFPSVQSVPVREMVINIVCFLCRFREVYPMFRPSGLFSFLWNWWTINLDFSQIRGATTWRPLYKRSTTVQTAASMTTHEYNERFQRPVLCFLFQKISSTLDEWPERCTGSNAIVPPSYSCPCLTLVQRKVSDGKRQTSAQFPHSLMPQVRSFSDVVDPRVASHISVKLKTTQSCKGECVSLPWSTCFLSPSARYDRP